MTNTVCTVARLVLINGAPASGKSTLARRYADEHVLTLVLDIDGIRGMLGRWLDASAEAGILARRMAVEMARVHLRAGHDVVVPQFLARLPFVLTLQELADDTGAQFVEVALLSRPEEVVDRFTRRTDGRGIEHLEAAELLEQSGGVSALPDMYRRMLELVADRPATRTVATIAGEIDQAYVDLLNVLSR